MFQWHCITFQAFSNTDGHSIVKTKVVKLSSKQLNFCPNLYEKSYQNNSWEDKHQTLKRFQPTLNVNKMPSLVFVEDLIVLYVYIYFFFFCKEKDAFNILSEDTVS